MIYANAHIPSYFGIGARQLATDRQIYSCNTYTRAVTSGAYVLVMIITTVNSLPEPRV